MGFRKDASEAKEGGSDGSESSEGSEGKEGGNDKAIAQFLALQQIDQQAVSTCRLEEQAVWEKTKIHHPLHVFSI